MEIRDSRVIRADRATVFAALISPGVLQKCVPGARQVTGTPEEGFEAVVVQKVGPVRATFKGHVTLSDLVENQALTLTGEGRGGAAGFARGAAVVRLEDHAGGTEVFYRVEARVGGKLAQLGNRVIVGFARKMVDQFLVRLQEVLEAPASSGDAAENTAGAPGPAPETGGETGGETSGEPDAASGAQKKGWLHRLHRRRRA